MTIDQQFIEYIIKSIVGDPDAVKIDRTVDEKGVLLTLTVAPDDLGRVIGKRGTTAQSLRTLLRALGTKNDARYNLKIVDLNRPETTPAPAAPEGGDEAAAVAEDALGAVQEVVADAPTEAPTEVAANDAQEIPQEAPVEESTPVADPDDVSDVVSNTLAELEDLDDLDV